MKMFFTQVVGLLALALGSCTSSQEKTVSTGPASPNYLVEQEQYRPAYHFTPPSKWMNDPNGMVYFNGEYHLFYQHYPDSTVWGPMHWGHAVSEDMVHWQHLPIALYPDSLGYIFSGSAVADVANTSGLGTRENPPLVAIFTYHDATGAAANHKDHQSQGIAYSLDNGRTWEKYVKNPVLSNPGNEQDFRDPKVFWFQQGKHWVMVLAVGDHVEFYASQNLTSWKKTGEFGKSVGAHGGVWECPDLFTLDAAGKKKWVMLLSINPGAPAGGSGTQYCIGDFNGKTFTSENPPDAEHWIDYGKDNYAGVTWNNVPDQDGRRVFLGWMSNWQYANQVPTKTWRSAMTTPRMLQLAGTDKGWRLLSTPVQELESLRGSSVDIAPQKLTQAVSMSDQLSFDASVSEIILNFEDLGKNQDFGIMLSNGLGQKVWVGYEGNRQQFYIDRTQSGKVDFSKDFPGRVTAERVSNNSSLQMHLMIDVASVELFADHGEVVMTDIFFPDEKFNQLTLYNQGEAVRLTGGKIYQLHSATKSQ